MADREHEDLIQGEIDGELDAKQRGDLARYLLANPKARELRNEFRQLCASLDSLPEAEPPPQLKDSILAALPQSVVRANQSFWSAPRWRYAALIAGALVAGAVVFAVVEGPGPATSELSGTMAAARSAIDRVRLEQGPVTGTVSLYRDAGHLALAFDLQAASPVGVEVETDGRTLRIEGVGQDGSAAQHALALPQHGVPGQTIGLTFLLDGRPVGRATLRVPGSP
jgi:anti-sigma factor RsiW